MAITKKIVLFLLVIALSTNLFAQQKNFIMRTMDWGYKIVQGDSANPKKKYYFIIPFASYKPETRWQLGLSFSHFFRAKNNDSLTRPSVVRLNVSYTQNNQYSIRPMFEVFTYKNLYSLRGILQYTKFIENYWGIGANTPYLNKELYSFNQYKINFKATRLIKKGLYAGIQFDYENLYNISNKYASVMPTSGVEGTTGYYALGLGPVITFDNRNHIYFPTKGHIIDISSTFHHNKFGSSSSFTNLNIDARKYVKLWKENVLAFQTYALFNQGNVPYRLMGTLGNESYFRGYYYGRFRDLNALTFQTELRKQIWGPLSMVAFGGLGNVSNQIADLNKNVKGMYGVGIRFKAIPREKINFRIDYAIGENGRDAFYITLNEAF